MTARPSATDARCIRVQVPGWCGIIQLMPILRLLLAGLVAVFAVLATAFAAVLVLFAGLAAWFMQLFRHKPMPAPPGPSAVHSPRGRTDDVIDVESTKVPPSA